MTIVTVRNEPLTRALAWAVIRALVSGSVVFLGTLIFFPTKPDVGVAVGVTVGLLIANLITGILIPTLAERRQR